MQRDLSERIAKFLVSMPFRKEFGERPDGDEGVFELVGDPRYERTNGRQPFDPPLFLLKSLNPREVIEHEDSPGYLLGPSPQERGAQHNGKRPPRSRGQCGLVVAISD